MYKSGVRSTTCSLTSYELTEMILCSLLLSTLYSVRGIRTEYSVLGTRYRVKEAVWILLQAF
jgi:hypothetical protein